jgi:hypothetical protein
MLKGGGGWVMVVVDGVYTCCHAEGKESRRGSIYFLLAYLYYFKTYCRRREVEVARFSFSTCIYIYWGGGGGR